MYQPFPHDDDSWENAGQVPTAGNPDPPFIEPVDQTPLTTDPERDAIWRAIYALGQHADQFHVNMRLDQENNQRVLESLVNRLSVLPSAAAAASTSAGIDPTLPSGSVRFHEPRIFNGSAAEVEPFLREVTNAVHLQRRQLPTDYDKCIYFSTYLKDGSPSSWYYAIEQTNVRLLQNWKMFVQNFRDHFGDPDLVASALRKMRALRQTGAAAVYASKFRELLVHLDLSESTKIENFHDGLKEEVKDLLVTVERSKNFDKFVEQVIVLDNRLHQRAIEKKATKPATSQSSRIINPVPRANPPAASSSTAPQPVHTSSDVVPMEIDAARHGPVTPAEKERRRKEGLCFYCGKGKHMVSDCPNMSDRAKKAMKARQASSQSGKA